MPATEPPRAPVRPRREPPAALGLVPPTAVVEVRWSVPGPMQAGAMAALGEARDAVARHVHYRPRRRGARRRRPPRPRPRHRGGPVRAPWAGDPAAARRGG